MAEKQHRLLDYRQVGPEWNEVTGPFDPRAAAGPMPAGPAPDGSPPRPEAGTTLRTLDERLSARTEDDLDVFAARWPALANETLALVVDGSDPAERRWNLASAANGTAAEHPDGTGEPVATLIAGPAIWGSLLGGETNIVTELTAGRLRCVNKRDTHRLRSEELHAMTWLLGLTQIPVERSATLAATEPG
jgi:hypothetical protein